MKFVIDDKIPYIRGVLEPFAQVVYAPGADIDRALVHDADGLIIRTRTKCNQQLLEGSRVKFIATATSGFDHIDQGFCRSQQIQWQNAPGCNAKSVEQYVATALVKLARKLGWSLAEKKLGVIGVGNTGSGVAKIAEFMGMSVLRNDPPRERAEGLTQFVSLREIKDHADIISLHVPLNMSGQDKTLKLIDTDFINRCRNKICLINTSRGPVSDNKAIKTALSENKLTEAILDVWENEPNIDPQLMDQCFIATPHIAGYAHDGKLTGTQMSIRAISQFFGLNLNSRTGPTLPEFTTISIPIKVKELPLEEAMYQAIEATYHIMNDDKRLRTSPDTFEKQRGDYPLRREITSHTVQLSQSDPGWFKLFKELGFKLI